CDTLMPQLRQVFHRSPQPLVIVDCDAADVTARLLQIKHDNRNIACHKWNGDLLIQRSCQNGDAANAIVDHLANRSLGAFWAVVRCAEEKIEAGSCRRCFKSLDHFWKDRVLDIGDQKPKEIAAASPSQLLCAGIRVIVQLARYFQHAAAGLRIYKLGLVKDAGDGCLGDTCLLGDISDSIRHGALSQARRVSSGVGKYYAQQNWGCKVFRIFAPTEAGGRPPRERSIGMSSLLR